MWTDTTHSAAANGSPDLHRVALAGNASPSAISHSFNALYKVLFIFPSQYFCTIGLSPVFSVGWSLPPFRAAFPNNPTRHQLAITSAATWHGGITLSAALFQETSMSRCPRPAMQPYNSHLRHDSHVALFPVHSPLLRESLLVSFPPLIDMLKFSGSSRLS